MHACLLIVPLLLATSCAALAQELPASAACRTALQALDRAEAALADVAASSPAMAVADRQRAALARLKPLRGQVGQACLGGLTTSPPPSQHTMTVPAPARPVVPMARPPPLGLLPGAAPPLRPEAPVTVSNCNAATCLGSDGSTLTRVGPNLVGPRGLCSVQGNVLRCP